MKVKFLFAAVTLMILSACGGGGGGSSGNGSMPVPVATELPFPLQASHDGTQVWIGNDQGTGVAGLRLLGTRGDVDIRHGELDDGVGRAAVQSYLVDALPAGSVVRRYPSAPEIRVIGTANSYEMERVAAAVQVVNAALPPAYRMTIGAQLPAFSLRDTVDANGFYFTSGNERANTIHIEFIPPVDYYDSDSGATTWNNFSGNSVTSTYIQMSQGTPAYENDRWAAILLAHEILHGLGLYAGDHVAVTFDTILEGTNDIYDEAQGIRQPGSLLYPVDREALRVFYGRLNNGDDPASFGFWESTSLHIHGNGEHAGFGVAMHNGYADPWAYGLRPNTSLSNNSALTGTVTWNGTMVGLTPQAASVVGDAEVSVDLNTLTGRTDFTSLESWAANAAPGDAGTGTVWGDGDLGYTISVQGNAFHRTGGDPGRLNGQFTGNSHEGAAGTLERNDLTAAFGATR